MIKGAARIAPGKVEAGGDLLETEHIVIATGSQPVRPDIDSLDQVPVWTNREATNVRDIPPRVLLIGVSAVGVEFGQFYARMGAQVTIVQRAQTLIDREEPRIGELARDALSADGVTVHTGRTAVRARPAGSAVITLDDGTETQTDVVILGAGRQPVTGGLDLNAVGVTPGAGEIPVDDHCRAADGLWAIGDVTGVSLFTHVAKYQGRVAADNILGRGRVASYQGIPRVVFADPEVAAVGLTAGQARERGIDVAAAEVAMAESTDRSWTYERDPRGALGLLADRRGRVLVGVGGRAAGQRVDPPGRAGDPRRDPRRHPARPGRAVPHLQRGLPRRAGKACPVALSPAQPSRGNGRYGAAAGLSNGRATRVSWRSARQIERAMVPPASPAVAALARSSATVAPLLAPAWRRHSKYMP